MRESFKSGSVGGAVGNNCFYPAPDRAIALPVSSLLNCRTLKLIGAGNSLYCSVSITDQKALQKLNSPINGQINRRRQFALIAA